jgi:hypothetical protein
VPARDPLVDLLDEGRAGEGVAARIQERSLRRAAEEGATLAGLLIDLAERGSMAAVHTESGARHHGTVVAVGADYCVVRTEAGAEPHLRLDAIGSVRPHPSVRQGSPDGDRRPVVDLLLVEVLGRAVEERPRVVLRLRGGERVVGVLRSTGADMVTLVLDGEHGQTCCVRAAAIAEVLIDQ